MVARLAPRALFGLVAMSWACATAPPPHTPRDACARPIADADWPSVSPESAGFDEVALCAALREAAASPDNVHALVLARRGALVAEFSREGRDTPLDVRYGLGRGKPTRFGPADRHDMRSISKSVVSLLVGITVDRGALRVHPSGPIQQRLQGDLRYRAESHSAQLC